MLPRKERGRFPEAPEVRVELAAAAVSQTGTATRRGHSPVDAP